MENWPFRKSLAVAVVILFLGVSVISSVVGDNSSFSNTIYVDDDAEPPYDGTQEHPYRHIQDAVDNASMGDTIFVYSGYYKENVITYVASIGECISNIKILGENKYTTQIESFRLYGGSRNITISGFTISGKFNYIWGGESTIKNNIFSSCNVALLIDSCYDDNIVIKNIFVNNNYGIEMRYCTDNNRIEGNHFENNTRHDLYISCQDDWPYVYPTKNIITKNNFLSAGKIYDNGYENRFISNYYYDWIGVKNKWLFFIPYIIPGRLIRRCPISHFDFSPKSIPYDIP